MLVAIVEGHYGVYALPAAVEILGRLLGVEVHTEGFDPYDDDWITNLYEVLDELESKAPEAGYYTFTEDGEFLVFDDERDIQRLIDPFYKEEEAQ